MAGSGLSIQQERALALTPKFTSSLSISCSAFLIYEVYSDHKKGGTNCIQRILVGMSIIDILASSAWFLSTWAVPKGSFAYAAGNKASCNFQGFLLQLAIGAPLYNSSLAIFYLLIIKKRWTDDQLAQIERWVHGFILSFTVGTSIILLFLEQYNHVGAVCWVIGDPSDCGNSSFQGSDTPCERGDHAYLYGLALFYGPLWICVLLCCISMLIMWHEVHKSLRRSRQYTASLGVPHSLNRSGQDSSRVAKQAILYSLTFVITWMPSTLWSIAHWFQWSHYGLDITAAAAEPLQGFWNLMVFLSTRPNSVGKIRRALGGIFPCCCTIPAEVDTSVDKESRLSSFSHAVKNVSSVFGPIRSSLHSSNRQFDDLKVDADTDACSASRLGFSVGSNGGVGSGLVGEEIWEPPMALLEESRSSIERETMDATIPCDQGGDDPVNRDVKGSCVMSDDHHPTSPSLQQAVYAPVKAMETASLSSFGTQGNKIAEESKPMPLPQCTVITD